VLAWIMEADTFSVPLDNLSGSVITRLCDQDTSERTSGYLCEIDYLDCGYTRSVRWQECEGYGLFGFPPVDPGVFQIHWGLLLLRVIAVREIPVVPTILIVPVRVPVIVDVFATVVFLSASGSKEKGDNCDASAEREFMLDWYFHFIKY
jgi:hypothetical protein